MKTMKLNLAVLSILLPVCVWSQNINPTVQVTNTFEGKLMESHKADLQMNVADSLLKFDWNFDYAVFDNPYKGAYDFTPYLIDTTPEANPVKKSKLYLRAGAGYSFHPELDFVYTPVDKEKVGISIYDGFSGYKGKWDVRGFPEGGGKLKRAFNADGSQWHNRLGMNFRFGLGRPVLCLDGGMDYYYADHVISGNDYTSFDVKASLDLKRPAKWNGIFSAAFVGGRGSTSAVSVKSDIQESVVDLNAVILKNYRNGNSFEFTLGGGYDSFSIASNTGNTAEVRLSGVYKGDSRRFHYRAGVLVSALGGSSVIPLFLNSKGELSDKQAIGNIIYPDLYIDFLLVPDALKLYASAVGGNDRNTVRSTIAERPFASVGRESDAFFAGYVNTPYKFNAGFTGRIGGRVQYDVNMGYKKVKNDLMEKLVSISSEEYELSLPLTCRADYTALYAAADVTVETERVNADASFLWQDTDFMSAVVPLEPISLRASASFTYNWHKRVFARVSASYTGKRGQSVNVSGESGPICISVPSFVDLGLGAEYLLNSHLSVWAKGGNLLGQPVYQQALYIQKGPWFTVGLRWNL